MKKLVTLLLTLVATTALWAYDFEVDGIYYNILTDKTNEVEVTHGAYHYSGSVTIPATVTYNGTTYSVTSIGDEAFHNCSYLTSVTIGNSVTSIGDDAFKSCSDLTSVTIGNSVTSIGDWAFEYCKSLTSVTIGNSVKSIGNGAFDGCSSLTSITIPNSVTSIGGYAFRDCSRIPSITIPNSVTSIGYRAFSNTGIYNDDSNWENGVLYISNCLIEVKSDQVAATYTIKDGTRVIAGGVFGDCKSLTSITIPNSVTEIGYRVFYGCSGLTSPVYNAHCFAYMPTSYEGAYTIPDGIKQIAGGAFERCKGLTSVTIPNSVKSIGYGAFYKCYGLTSVTIPNSVTSIGYRAFRSCSSLTSVTLGNNVTSIGNNAFGSCNKIQEVTAYMPTPIDAKDCGINPAAATLYVPAEYIDTYSNTLWWEDFKEIRAITTTAAPEVYVNPANPAQKLLRNGQVYILQDGKTYTITGQRF